MESSFRIGPDLRDGIATSGTEARRQVMKSLAGALLIVGWLGSIVCVKGPTDFATSECGVSPLVLALRLVVK